MVDPYDEYGPIITNKPSKPISGAPRRAQEPVKEIKRENISKNKETPPEPPKPSKRNPGKKVEGSKAFQEWFSDCENLVLEGWYLSVKDLRKYHYIVMKNGTTERPFAYVEKKTGNIHNCMVHGPFEYVRGNISDPETRLKDVTPYGIKAFWSFHPTHPDYKCAIITAEQTEDDNEEQC